MKRVSTGYKVNGLTSSYSKFLDKLSSDWKYTIPSDNLWTVLIKLHDDGDTTSGTEIDQLYSNINTVNRNYFKNIGGAWDVKALGMSLSEVNNGTASQIIGEYYSGFKEELGLFLCQGVSIPNMSLRHSYQFGGSIGEHSGFIRAGNYVSSRVQQPLFGLNIIETNISLRDVLFEKWIAAIAQQGLIEDETLPNIKADIYLYNYSCGVPGYNEAKWQLRRAIKFVKCYPFELNNSEVRSGYEQERAGTAKTFTVQLAFDDMVSDYKILPDRGVEIKEGLVYGTDGSISLSSSSNNSSSSTSTPAPVVIPVTNYKK